MRHGILISYWLKALRSFFLLVGVRQRHGVPFSYWSNAFLMHYGTTFPMNVFGDTLYHCNANIGIFVYSFKRKLVSITENRTENWSFISKYKILLWEIVWIWYCEDVEIFSHIVLLLFKMKIAYLASVL